MATAVALLSKTLEFVIESVATVEDQSPPPPAATVLAVVGRTRAVLPWKVTRDSVLVDVLRYAPPPRAPAADTPTQSAELLRRVELVMMTLADEEETCSPPPCAK